MNSAMNSAVEISRRAASQVTAPAPLPLQRPIGELLRHWREQRRLSQLEFALQAQISTRHLSFLETGRSRPSRDMVLRLAERLDVPLRERNHLLLAAGYAPAFSETALDAPDMSSVRAAIHQILTGHEPYPALIVDRLWNIVDANAGLALFTRYVPPKLLQPAANCIRIALHPDGLAPHIANLGEWRAHLLSRVRRQIVRTGETNLIQLYEEVRAYPCDQSEPEIEIPGPGDIVVPLRFRHAGQELVLFSTVAAFGTPLDITVAELAIESFFPADAHTASILRDDRLADAAGPTNT